jgi:hypothetical protein
MSRGKKAIIYLGNLPPSIVSPPNRQYQLKNALTSEDEFRPWVSGPLAFGPDVRGSRSDGCRYSIYAYIAETDTFCSLRMFLTFFP